MLLIQLGLLVFMGSDVVLRWTTSGEVPWTGVGALVLIAALAVITFLRWRRERDRAPGRPARAGRLVPTSERAHL